MIEKEKNFVSVVIYVHNAENRIGKFLTMIMKTLEEHFEHSEIICVNDNSVDDSLMIIRDIGKGAVSSCISVLNMSYFHGIEMAMNAGVDLSIGDFVFEFNTTILDFNKVEIMGAYYHLLEGYDIVSVSPDKKERLSSRLFYSVFEHFTDISYKMSTESFCILSRRAINRVSSMSKTIPYRKAVYVNCGLKRDNMKYQVQMCVGGYCQYR